MGTDATLWLRSTRWRSLGDGTLMALDGKMVLDDNALFRHPELAAMRDEDEETSRRARGARSGLSFVKLDGEIGCMVNGAGLAMATMDIIKLYGGEPANFLDIGGGAKLTRSRRRCASSCPIPTSRPSCSISSAASRVATRWPGASSQALDESHRPMCRWWFAWSARTTEEGRAHPWPRQTWITAKTLVEAAQKAVAAARAPGGEVDEHSG